MSERYSKLFNLPENLYAEGSPVVISAGVLLKDTATGNVLVQLKIKNITNSVIKAATVKIEMYDVKGNLINGEKEYQYLDLNVLRNVEFGQQVPIMLPDSSARSFNMRVKEIIFQDGSIWVGLNKEWEALTKQESVMSIFNLRDDNSFEEVPEEESEEISEEDLEKILEEVYDSNIEQENENDDLDIDELFKQYKIKFGAACVFKLQEERDLIICSCGAINRQDEVICSNCNNNLKELKDIDIETLTEEMNQRLLDEKKRKEELYKLVKKGIIAAIPVLILIIVLSSINNTLLKKYERALNNRDAELFYSTTIPDSYMEKVYDKFGSKKAFIEYAEEESYSAVREKRKIKKKEQVFDFDREKYIDAIETEYDVKVTDVKVYKAEVKPIGNNQGKTEEINLIYYKTGGKWYITSE